LSLAAGPAARNGTTFLAGGTGVSSGFGSSDAIAVSGGMSGRALGERRTAAALSAATSRHTPNPR
jgi:hypothetical protein